MILKSLSESLLKDQMWSADNCIVTCKEIFAVYKSNNPKYSLHRKRLYLDLFKSYKYWRRQYHAKFLSF